MTLRRPLFLVTASRPPPLLLLEGWYCGSSHQDPDQTRWRGPGEGDYRERWAALETMRGGIRPLLRQSILERNWIFGRFLQPDKAVGCVDQAGLPTLFTKSPPFHSSHPPFLAQFTRMPYYIMRTSGHVRSGWAKVFSPLPSLSCIVY